ncbi:MAG: hypothetical protein N2595_11015 [bacterium]|nr:hypothetical protein [bacterium]
MRCVRLSFLLLLITLSSRAATNFVAHGGAHIPPFASWATAATNVSAAIAVATDGNLVMISNGWYVGPIALTNRSLAFEGQGEASTFLP